MSSKKQADKPKRGRGRPPKPLDKEQLRKDLSEGATKQDAYTKQDMRVEHATTIEKKDPELSKVVKEGLQEFLDREVFPKKAFIVSAFWQKIAEGDTSAIIYGMKTVVGLKESRSVEVSGEIAHVHTLSPEDRAKRIALLRQELDAQVVDVAIEDSTEDESQGGK